MVDKKPINNKPDKETGLYFRLPPALTHGSYSSLSVLPGEDPKEYEKMRLALVAEYRPDGPLELNAVNTIAQCTWRIDHFTVFQRAKLARSQYKKGSIHSYGFNFGSENEKAFEERVMGALRGDSYFDGGKENQSVRVIRRNNPTLNADIIQDPGQFDEEYQLAWLGNIVTLENLDKELEILERLEARISRAMKTLLQSKATKQLIGTAPASRVIPVPSSTPALGSGNQYVNMANDNAHGHSKETINDSPEIA